jgi:hypothetical protein
VDERQMQQMQLMQCPMLEFLTAVDEHHVHRSDSAVDAATTSGAANTSDAANTCIAPRSYRCVESFALPPHLWAVLPPSIADPSGAVVKLVWTFDEHQEPYNLMQAVDAALRSLQPISRLADLCLSSVLSDLVRKRRWVRCSVTTLERPSSMPWSSSSSSSSSPHPLIRAPLHAHRETHSSMHRCACRNRPLDALVAHAARSIDALPRSFHQKH